MFAEAKLETGKKIENGSCRIFEKITHSKNRAKAASVETSNHPECILVS